MSIPVISIIGKSGSGKTTLLEKLIPELKRRGYRLATVKHHAHPGFEIDQPGKDTWRHARAGSDVVVISAPEKIATIRSLGEELTLDEIVAGIDGVDLILTEGYKRAGKPSIEVMKDAPGAELLGDPEQVIAIAAGPAAREVFQDAGIPAFDRNDPVRIADFIEKRFLG
jgi:molybdopterin-guanine dinucleotide biosynthesis protein B